MRKGGQSQAIFGLEEVTKGLQDTQRIVTSQIKETMQDTEEGRLAGTLIREDLRDLRTVPASLVLDSLRLVVRDVADRLGKQVDLSLLGTDVRLDRRILDEMKDPLLHLVRNAMDHGMETVEER